MYYHDGVWVRCNDGLEASSGASSPLCVSPPEVFVDHHHSAGSPLEGDQTQVDENMSSDIELDDFADNTDMAQEKCPSKCCTHVVLRTSHDIRLQLRGSKWEVHTLKYMG